jgi:hypothetical protein
LKAIDNALVAALVNGRNTFKDVEISGELQRIIALRKYIKTIAEGSMYTNFYILNTDVLTLMRSAILSELKNLL